MQQQSDAVWSYHASYSRNARAVGLGWALCAICFTVLAIVAFGQPHWIANYDTSPFLDREVGYFGLFKRCTAGVSEDAYHCQGGFSDWDGILNSNFKIATVLQGAGVVLMLLCVVCLLLFFMIKASSAYTICGGIQFLAG